MPYGIKTQLDKESLEKTKSEFNDFVMKLESGEGINLKLKTDDVKKGLDDVKKSVDDVGKGAGGVGDTFHNTNEAGKSIGETIGHCVTKVAEWAIGTTIVYETINKIKDGMQFISELNTKDTNIAMITDKNLKDVEDYNEGWNKMAINLKTTTNEVVDAEETFLRAGKGMDEANKMVDTNVKLARIANDTNKDTAEQLIIVSNAYNLNAEGVEKYANKVAYLDSATATTSSNINKAVLRTVQEAKESGTTVDFLLGIVATIQEKTKQAPESVGRALRSMFLNIQQIQKGAKTGVSDLEATLAKQGIAVRENANTWRDSESVIKDIMGKWKEWDDVTKSQVSQMVAGKNFSEQFNIIMNDSTRVMENYNSSLNATNTLQEKYEKHLESTGGATNELKAKTEKLWLGLMDSSAIKRGTSALTGLVTILETLTVKHKLVGVAVLAMSVQLVGLIRNVNLLKMAFTSLKALSLGSIFAFATSPAVLLTGAIIGLIAVTERVTRKQEQFKEQIDKNKKSVNDLNEAIKSMDKAQIKSNLQPLEDEQKKLQDNLKLREDINKKIEETAKITNTKTQEAELEKLATQYKRVNKEINTQTKELKEAGIAFDEQTGEIDKVVEAEGKLKSIEGIEKLQEQKKKTQEMVETYKELSQASNLNNEQEQKLADSKNYLIGVLNNEKSSVMEAVTRYSELLEMKERTDAENAEMADLLGFLKGKEDDLNVSIVDSTGVLDGNKEEIGNRIGALDVEGVTLGNLAQAEYRSAKDRAMVQVGLTKMTVAEVRKRIQAYQAEARALQQSLDATNNLKSALDKTSGYGGSGYNAFDIKVDLLEGSLERNKKTFDKLDNALGDLDKLESSGGGGDIPSPSGGYEPTSNGSGRKGGGKSDSGSGKEKHESAQKEVADLDVKIDRYHKLNEQLKDYEYYREEISAKKDMAKTDKEKLDLMKQEISLLEKKRLKIDELRKEQQAEEGEFANKLQGWGFNIKWEQGSDGEWLVTLEDYKAKLKEWVDWANSKTGDAKEEAIKQVKEIEEAIKDYTDITHDKLAQTQSDWNANAKAIADTKKEMEDLAKNKMKDYIEKQKEADYMEQEEKHKKENIELEKSIYEVSKEQFEAYKTSKINGINEEITKLHDKLLVDAENIDTQDALKAKFEELKMVQDEQFDKIKNYQEVYEKTYKERMENIDKEIKILDDKYEAEQKAEEEAENRAKEEEERKNRLKDIADSQKEINELEKQLINLKKEKNIRTLTKDSEGKFQWDWTHNQQEYEKVQEDINNKEEDLKKKHQEMAKWEQDLIKQKEKKKKEEEHKSQRDKLENEKKYLEEVLRIQQQKYEQQKKTLEAKQQAEKDLLDAHYKDVEALTDKWLNELKQIYGENWSQMSIIVDEKVTTMEKRIKEMIDAINLANQAVAGLGSGNSGITSGMINVGGKVLTSEERYLTDNPDVKAMLQSGNAPFKSGRQHWELWGKDEGRSWGETSITPPINSPWKSVDYGGNQIGKQIGKFNNADLPKIHNTADNSTSIQIQTVELKNVKNGSDFVSELQGLSQKAKQRFR